ncbi:23S rRNA (pseudouridine(1915)-N(3))-methyltransferase RlmH [Muribaculum caecicola]|jgi:23S rRNA (pseudouridine1915-N3)-methyltransferase|uniref:23S rRNA (Pseudouridine(1915)-N(3))-methyltransferase RlmH n=1 Tax=Muribaculum caecicola TaxID=3038144 RepID=A0AC61S5S7_9BACT|nr:23S rRNA (pseudouridine(1915)-N(3))-methyltransferase RlmH [Muribaculum caecicola]THG51648.1 23S rRNA (pseudouridine(1915)-N(3))-methyltransferase RlmH [Muribaculum caecicola]
MKIQFMAVGKTTTAYLQQGIKIYTDRLSHYIPFETTIIPDIKNSKSISEQRQKELEGQAMLQRIGNSDYVVLLDEKGHRFTSRQFAAFIEKKMLTLPQRLTFIIGGPYGFSTDVYNRANQLISLSDMTFSHEMVRLFFVEQLYRAFTIIGGEPYHHD